LTGGAGESIRFRRDWGFRDAIMRAVQIDVWSDYVCPFCYLAEPALAELAADGDGEVTIGWRAFELRPEPIPTLDPKGDYLRDTWARSVYPMARQRGMKLMLPPVQPRSRLAHEAAAHAAARGKQVEMPHAIFRAFFEDGIDIGSVEELTKLAAQCGLDPAEMEAALKSGRYRPQVIEDEELAQSFGLSGVPAIVVRAADAPWEQAVLVSGAQPYEVLHQAVAQVRESAG
jgi:predicted DsbA family dithiol-disulfide isomerase